MKLLRVLVIIIASGLTGTIIHSCCEGYQYRWTYIIAKCYNTNTRTGNNNEYRNISAHIDSVQKEYLGIRVHLFNQIYAAACNGTSGNNLYAAYDCWPIYAMEDSIIDIHIITLNQFNTSTDSGAEVTRFFNLNYFGYDRDIIEAIQYINAHDNDVIEDLEFVINDNTVKDSVQQFIFEVFLSDNTVMSDTTDPIKLY